ncbi:MAG: MATE family efflux transporter [Synergistaceae bacterium]|jgi:putative MATE family efflux protein|nr:MATE family efflux transporter [Synergistaceae bacterium]
MDSVNQKYDLTRGGISDKLLLVAMPIIGTQFMMMSYNLVDVFLLGRVGSEAVASSGIAGMYMWLFGGFLLVGRMGAEIGVSQNMGRKDPASAVRFSWNSMFLSFVIGTVLLVLCAAFSSSLIGFFNIREEAVAEGAREYLIIVSAAIPFSFAGASAAGTFNGAGNSKVPFMINSACLVLNAALDIFFIFTLEMGVKGAAAATAISQITACMVSLAALKARSDRPFSRFSFRGRPEPEVILQILRWGIPIGTEGILFTFFTMFISRFAAAYGAGAIAVYRIGSQIESLCWLTGMGISTSVAAFVGQNYGAGLWERILGCCRIALKSFIPWGIFVTVLLNTAGRSIFGLFLPDGSLLDVGASFLRIISCCQVTACLEAVASGTFRGLGRTIPPSGVSAVCNALRVPLAYALSQTGLGLDGIWVGLTIGACVRGLWIFIWFLFEMRTRTRAA